MVEVGEEVVEVEVEGGGMGNVVEVEGGVD